MKLLHDPDLEKAILGILLEEPRLLIRTKPVIQKLDYFYNKNHRLIYSALLDLEENSSIIDMLTVGDYLHKTNKLKQIGGYAFLAELSEYYQGAHIEVKIDSYANTLREDYQARKACFYVKKMVEKINHVNQQDYGKEPYSIYDAVSETIGSLQSLQADLGAKQNQTRTIAEITPVVFEELEKNLKGEIKPALSTGFSDLDKFLGGGLYRAELNILAARPSVGKTTLAVNIANNLSPQEKILLISLETTGESILRDRLIPMTARVPATKIRMPQILEGDELDSISASMMKFGSYKVFKINDQATLKISDIENLVAEEAMSENGLSFLIIDYMQLIRSDRKMNVREQEVANISLRLKALIKQHKLYSLILAQLNRETEKQKRPPVLSDLRESGQIDQDADTIIFLHENKEEQNSPLLVKIAKNKNGPQGELELYLDKEHLIFNTLAKNY